MRFAALFFLITLFASGAAHAADQWQAREVAIMNNCPPKKISVYQATPGTDGKTIFRVDCDLPKGSAAGSAPAATALLIGCDQSLCEMLRPLEADSK